jgi:hypothetical protein
LFHTALRAAIRSRNVAKTSQYSIDATVEIFSQPSRTVTGKMEGLPFQIQLETSLKRGHAPLPKLTGDGEIASNKSARFHIQGLPMLLSTASQINAGEMTLSDEDTTISWYADKTEAGFDEYSFSSSIFECPLG